MTDWVTDMFWCWFILWLTDTRRCVVSFSAAEANQNGADDDDDDDDADREGDDDDDEEDETTRCYWQTVV